MSYKIDLSKDAEKVIRKWHKSSPHLYKKTVDILNDIALHPRTGIGHPEALKGKNNITYSRRIAGQHRIIYDVYDQTVSVLILEIGGHYGDK